MTTRLRLYLDKVAAERDAAHEQQQVEAVRGRERAPELPCGRLLERRAVESGQGPLRLVEVVGAAVVREERRGLTGGRFLAWRDHFHGV